MGYIWQMTQNDYLIFEGAIEAKSEKRFILTMMKPLAGRQTVDVVLCAHVNRF